MIKAIIFDCFGVLTADPWKEFVSGLPEAQRDEARLLNHAYDAGQLNKKEFLEAVENLTGDRPRYIDDRFDEGTFKNNELITYIRTLRGRYKIGLLSNIATDWIIKHFLTSEEQQLFDDFIFSYQVGTTKPDPRIFETSVKNLNVLPEECVFIDDVERYCAAAHGVGMQAITYQDFEQMKRELESILANSKR